MSRLSDMKDTQNNQKYFPMIIMMIYKSIIMLKGGEHY